MARPDAPQAKAYGTELLGMPTTFHRSFRIFAPDYTLSYTLMKKTTAFSSLLLLGGLGSLGFLTAQLAGLNLTFSLRGEEDHHYL
jgi:hypothetical protein